MLDDPEGKLQWKEPAGESSRGDDISISRIGQSNIPEQQLWPAVSKYPN
jgi:hypothetical protein